MVMKCILGGNFALSDYCREPTTPGDHVMAALKYLFGFMWAYPRPTGGMGGGQGTISGGGIGPLSDRATCLYYVFRPYLLKKTIPWSS